jgi:hypothetical protein
MLVIAVLDRDRQLLADTVDGFRGHMIRSVGHAGELRAVVYMASLPLDANVQFMTVMAIKMPFVGRG